jgi:hypothetical protein
MVSILAISKSDAKQSLETYCSRSNHFSWPYYDIDETPNLLVPTDILATSFLDYPIKGKIIQKLMLEYGMYSETNPYTKLSKHLSDVVSDESAKGLCFDDIPEEQLGDRLMGGWGKVLDAIDAAQECKSLTSVFVTKVLHRKRPNLVPINDSKLRSFYGIKKHSYSELFLAIHRDVVQNRDYLNELRGKYVLPSGVVMSRLRVLDIMVWMNQ